MSLSKKPHPRTGSKWTREEVFLLLCALNLNIDSIAPNKAECSELEWKGTIKSATSLLADKLDFSASPSRVEAKLALLWQNCGDPYGRQEPYALYESGAFSKTLPGLENPKNGFPGMLSEIAEEVYRKQQFMTKPGDLVQTGRRSNRAGARDTSQDPFICRCGFTHQISAIHCGDCHSWQHALCYYETQVREYLPDKHQCDSCVAIGSVDDHYIPDAFHMEQLQRSMKGIDLDLTQKIALPSPQSADGCYLPAVDAAPGLILGPFGFSHADTMRWGPSEADIESIMECILSRIEEAVYLLLRAGISIRKTRKTMFESQSLDLKNILWAAHGEAYHKNLLHRLSEPKRSPIKISRMLAGLVSSIVFELALYRKPASESSTLPLFWNRVCHRILQTNGSQTLRHLRRSTLVDLLTDKDGSLDSAISKDTTSLTAQVSMLLFNMLTVSGVSGTKLPPDWYHSDWQDQIKKAFSLCLELRLKLALSERFFGVHFVPIGSDTSSDPMVDTAGDPIRPGERVEICLMPALIEFDPAVLDKEPADLFVLPFEEIFIRVKAQDKSKGALVSRAIIETAS